MAAWPGTLPQVPLADGFSESHPELAIRTNMDVGPAKVRRRQTAGVITMTCNFRLTTAQRATLVTFWQTTIAGGASTFTWVHPITSAAITCRMVNPPQFTPLSRGLYWRASLVIEVLP